MSNAKIMSKRLWLDDVRRPPTQGWVWARSVKDALEILETGTVVEASLDNDLHPFERDGIEVIEWMVAHQVWPRLVRVHSANRFASTRMCRLLERNGYRWVPGRPRHFIRSDGTSRSIQEFAAPGYQGLAEVDGAAARSSLASAATPSDERSR